DASFLPSSCPPLLLRLLSMGVLPAASCIHVSGLLLPHLHLPNIHLPYIQLSSLRIPVCSTVHMAVSTISSRFRRRSSDRIPCWSTNRMIDFLLFTSPHDLLPLPNCSFESMIKYLPFHSCPTLSSS
ncbi:hypothetical protein PMAYCL1PPCAC_33230, partial [Pristionchus mayeri]